MLAAISKPYVAIIDGITSKHPSFFSLGTNPDYEHSGGRSGLVGDGTVQDCHRNHQIRDARNEDWLRSGCRG